MSPFPITRSDLSLDNPKEEIPMSLTDTEIDKASTAPADDDDTDNSRLSSPKSDSHLARAARVPRQVSFSLRTAVVSVVIALQAGAAGMLGWLYIGAQTKIDAQGRDARNREHAEEIAADYAVNAAQMDYQDFNAWKVKLVKGTSAELKEKLTKAADSMEQVLAPLQWKSTARPLATKVRSDAGGIYTVDSFVSVLTKTMQAPDGLQSTATYSLTVDSNNNWQISDVGGIDSALGK
jgi:Mce-associated membrane protein